MGRGCNSLNTANTSNTRLLHVVTPLDLYICKFLADGHEESSVKFIIVALQRTLRERNFVLISIFLDEKLVFRGHIQASTVCSERYLDY